MRHALLLPLFLAACVTAPEDKPYYWKLVSIDGQPFAANATLAIDGTRAFGQGPCNRWTGQIETDPFPEWRIRKVAATMMACDQLAEEQVFFTAMQAMTHQSVGIGHLELADQKGREMKFVPVVP